MNIVGFSTTDNINNQVQVPNSGTGRELGNEIIKPVKSPSKNSSFFQKWWKVIAIAASIN